MKRLLTLLFLTGLLTSAQGVPLGWNQVDTLSYGRLLRLTINGTNSGGSGGKLVDYSAIGSAIGATAQILYTCFLTNLICGGAYYLYGNSFASCPTNFPTTNITISVWLKIKSTLTTSIFQNGHLANGWSLAYNNLVPEFDNTGVTSHATTLKLNTNDVFLLVATYAALSATIYMYDATTGTATNQTVVTTVPTAPSADYYWGCDSYETTFFNGTLDETCVWNRQLTATEIQQLYNGGYSLP